MKNRTLGNKYEIVERLGRGGMAEVYRAHHISLDRYVAIKILHDFLADDPEFKSRFEKEARNIAKLKHRNIVQVYDFEFDPENQSYYMVMELIDGVTLKDMLLDSSHTHDQLLPLEEALRMTREAASALEYAHKAGMIHRDVKPANLIIDRADNDRVVLTDFGIAKMVTSAQFTMTGGLIGTPAYMAPEQGVGETGDERSDLYSLGVILYQMVTGDLPYDAETPLALILKHLNDAIPSARIQNPKLPPRVDEIIQKALAKDMETRYQTASEFIEDIVALEEEIKERKEKGSAADPYGVDSESTLILPKHRQMDGPTRPFKAEEQMTPILESKAVRKAVNEAQQKKRRSPFMWVAGLLVAVLLGIGGYALAVQNDIIPPISGGGSVINTPTPEAELATDDTTLVALVTAEVETTEEPSPSPTATLIPTTEQPTVTSSPTDAPEATNTPTITPSPTETHTPTYTLTPTWTPTPSITATVEDCVYDYAIIEQNPEDGEAGDFFPINTDYARDITLLNTGTCEWGRNTSLAFVTGSGESFNAGPRIFIRDIVGVGQEVTITFEGTLPSRGSLNPLAGDWQLRTPDQIPIGDPMTISILVYDPGN